VTSKAGEVIEIAMLAHGTPPTKIAAKAGRGGRITLRGGSSKASHARAQNLCLAKNSFVLGDPLRRRL
jgi:hypothetical protein